jgi:hypothetical protein
MIEPVSETSLRIVNTQRIRFWCKSFYKIRLQSNYFLNNPFDKFLVPLIKLSFKKKNQIKQNISVFSNFSGILHFHKNGSNIH